MSNGSTRAVAPDAESSHPALWLWPSTSQKGPSAPVTERS